MGVYRSAYLGPYVELRLPVVQQKRDLCKQPENCPNPKGSAFCEKCGIKVADRWHKWDDVEHDPMTLMEEFGEALMAAESNYGAEREGDVFLYRLLPNQNRKSPRKLHIEDDAAAIPVELAIIEVELAWFKRAFAEELQGLRAAYETFEIKWGFLQWHR